MGVAAIIGVVATAGVILSFYEHFKPVPGSISQTATSANGNASNSATSNAPSGPSANQPAVQQSATAQKQGDATNTVASGQGNATGQKNVTGEGNNVASVSGGDTTVYVGSGGTENFYSPIIYAPPKSHPDTPVTIGQKKFPATTVNRFNKLKKVVQAQRYHGAFTPINFFLDDNPTFAPAHNEYAIQLFVQGKYDLAEEEWKRAIALDPTNVLYYNNLSQARSRGSLSVIVDVSHLRSQFDGPSLIGMTTGDRGGKTVVHRAQGSFIVTDESDVPLYDIKVTDYAVSPLPTKNEYVKGVELEKKSRDGFPLIGEKNFGPFTPGFDNLQPMEPRPVQSLFGTNTSLDPNVIRVMEKQVTFSRQPGGPVETLDFKFVIGKNAKGEWAWFPQI